MNKAEFLIFEYVVTGEIPISWLTATNIGELLNLPPHGLTNDELTDTLYRMFQDGDLFTSYPHQENEEQFVPTKEGLAFAIQQDTTPATLKSWLYYGQTRLEQIRIRLPGYR